MGSCVSHRPEGALATSAEGQAPPHGHLSLNRPRSGLSLPPGHPVQRGLGEEGACVLSPVSKRLMSVRPTAELVGSSW